MYANAAATAFKLAAANKDGVNVSATIHPTTGTAIKKSIVLIPTPTMIADISAQIFLERLLTKPIVHPAKAIPNAIGK